MAAKEKNNNEKTKGRTSSKCYNLERSKDVDHGLTIVDGRQSKDYKILVKIDDMIITSV